MGKTITTYLMTDNPNGAQYVLISNKICKMLVVPREEMSIVNSRSEFMTPCLYILLNSDESDKKAYIGQSESFRERVNDHKRNKEFWDKALVFVSIAASLTKSDVQFLEYRAIKEAKACGIYTLPENKVVPSKNSMPEHLEEQMNEFFQDVKFLTAFTGCDIFMKVQSAGKEYFYITGRGANAKGYYDAEAKRFVVMRESLVAPDCTNSFGNRGKAKREKLLSEVAEKKNGLFVLKSDCSFTSPSSAADFCIGNSTNGWIHWKNQDGKTLDELVRQVGA